jgi:hypothetical protein
MQTAISSTETNEATQTPALNIPGLTSSAVLSSLPQTNQPTSIRPDHRSVLANLKKNKAPTAITAAELPPIARAIPNVFNPEINSATVKNSPTPVIESRVATPQPIVTKPATPNVNLAISEPAIEIPVEINTIVNQKTTPSSNLFKEAANNILSFARKVTNNTSTRLLGEKSKILTTGSTLHEIESKLGQ